MRNTHRTVIPGWLGAAAVAVVLFAVPLPEWVVEQVYSRRAFRWWQAAVTSLSNLAPFALLDVFIVGLVVLTAWRVARLAGVVRQSGVVAAAWEGVRRLIRAAAVLGIVFLLMWGLNYRRVPLERSVPPAADVSVDELRGVIDNAGALAARLRSSATDYPSFEDVTVWLHDPLNDALAAVGRPRLERPGRPKFSLVLSPFFTWAGVDGMIDPFALETIVHPDLLPFERPFALAHEWAHLAGSADEADASAVGWLACMLGRPELAYSASVYLIVEAGGALPRRAWEEVRRRLDPAILSDLEALSRRLAKRKPQVQRTAFRVYDKYLRANRVEDGMASYSRALSLILSPGFRDALNGYRVDRGPRR